MSKLTAIILTKNEEEMIADCIDSLSFCDEIIIIDSCSTDRTADIAKKMGAKIYQTEDDDFSKRRELGLQKTRTSWLLYVDADERVNKELVNEIKNTISNKNNLDAYRLSRKNYYFGNYEWPYIEKLERLFKKSALLGWQGKLHETPQIKGEIGDLNGFIIHYTHRDLSSMLQKTIEWSAVEAKLRYDSNHPPVVWWRFPRVMLTAFYDSYIKQKGYKVGKVGLIESIYQMFSIFITYARLWEMQDKKRKMKNDPSTSSG